MNNTTRPSFRLAHTSDTHLGYEAYKATSSSGHNQRGQDLVKAFLNVVKDIVAYDPPLVVLPGDITDTPNVGIRYMVVVRELLTQLASIRPDGTRRQVVVSSGNHDQPRQITEFNFLELFKGVPGVHVVTTRYEQIEFPDAGVSAGRDDVLADVTVHVLPHDQLKRVEWDQVRPTDARTNILMAHGVAGGSELYVRSLGREFAVPSDVLNLEWEYVALGHWHKRCPVNDRAWYCGSPENVSFRDLRDNGDKRGYLRVEIHPGHLPDVTTVDLPIRRMFRLPDLDAAGMDADEISSRLVAAARKADLTGAVVWQVVTGVTADRWALVDRTAPRKAAGKALHYQLTAKFSGGASERRASRGERDEEQLADVGELLEERAAALLGNEAAGAAGLARKLVSEQLQAAGDEQTADTVDATAPSPAAGDEQTADTTAPSPTDGAATARPDSGGTVEAAKETAA